MLKKLVLIGGGGFSSEVAEVAVQNSFDVIGYVDSKKTASSHAFLGTPESYFARERSIDFVFPAYGAVDRKGLLRRAASLGGLTEANIPFLVSEHAYVSKSVKLGRGAFVSHGVVINPEANIGNFSIINSGSIIGHNVAIGDYSIVSGNAFVGGGCAIGSNTLVGPGAVIMQSLSIGSEVIVSIGSVVVRSIPSGKTTLPSPSKYV